MSTIDKTLYFGSREACKLLGIHPRTLYLWESKGKIETVRSSERGKRFYNVNKYLKDNGVQTNISICDNVKCDDPDNLGNDNKYRICYARVSSIGQKDDLERQKRILKEKYPDHKMIEDIGSGINLTKRGLKKVIELGIEGKLEELVIVHKDRLARFGYDLIEHLIAKYSRGRIVIIEKKKEIEPEAEMVQDVLQIMNVFVAKMNGRRKYKNKDVKKVEKNK